MRQGNNHHRWRAPIAVAIALLLAAAGISGIGLTSAAAAEAPSAAPSAGCGKPPTLSSGPRSIQSSGRTRNYILRVPATYDNNRPYRVVFGFHWNGGTANDVDSGGTSGYPWSYYGLRAISNDSAIFVAPQGLGNGWANSNGEDLTFVDDMIRQIDAGLCVDTNQRFAGGFSYGGGMSFALACARPTVFRAVAVYAGGQLSGCNGGTQPVAYIGLHGLRDPVLPIATGRSLRDRFVRNNGCTAQNPPEPARGSLTHVVTTYSGCRAGYPWHGPRSTRAILRVPSTDRPATTNRVSGRGPGRWCGTSSRSSTARIPPRRTRPRSGCATRVRAGAWTSTARAGPTAHR